MTPQIHDNDYAQSAAKHLFLVQLRNQPSVKDVFFHSNNRLNHRENRSTVTSILKKIPSFREFDFDRFAVLFVCQVICKLRNRFNFHELVDEERVKEELGCFYHHPLWTNLGFELYCISLIETMVDLRTAFKFREFLESDKMKWAQKILVHYRSDINILIDFPFVDQSSQATQASVNLLLTKVHLLDPSKTEPLFEQLSKLIPDIKLEFQTIKHLGSSLDWRVIKEDVEDAILKPTLPSNVSKMSLYTLEMFHGIRVCEFIMSEAREMGVWTGKHPDNQSTSDIIDRCTIS